MHFSHAGFPIAGDTLYGGGEQMLKRTGPLFQGPAAGLIKRLSSQALHAVKLEFKHPVRIGDSLQTMKCSECHKGSLVE